MFAARRSRRGRFQSGDAAVVGQFAPQRLAHLDHRIRTGSVPGEAKKNKRKDKKKTDLVHAGAVDGFGTVLQPALVVDVVHGAGRQFRIAEVVIGGPVLETGAPVAVQEARDVAPRTVGPDDGAGLGAQLRRHDVLAVARQRLAAVGRSVVIGAETFVVLFVCLFVFLKKTNHPPAKKNRHSK